MINDWKIDRILELLTAAGAAGLKRYCRIAPEYKADNSPVTAADTEIERMLISRLSRPSDGIFAIGEESIGDCDAGYLDKALTAPSCYVIDPIDGTAPYVCGVPLWGVSLGLMRNGSMAEGAIYLPVQDEAFISCRGELFRACGLQSGSPETARFDLDAPPYLDRLPVCSAQHAARTRRMTFRNTLFLWGTCVGVYYGLLHRRLYAYVQYCKLWDFAGGAPLLRAAGFTMKFEDGSDFDFAAAGRNFRFGADAGPRRWLQRGYLIIAPDETAWRYISGSMTEHKEK